MLTLTGVAGQVMLVLGGVLLVTASLAVVPSALRARRRAMVLRAHVLAGRQDIVRALERMHDGVSEANGHLTDIARVVRWLRHPLVTATIQWYGRRRRR